MQSIYVQILEQIRQGYRGQGAKDILIDLLEDSETTLQMFISILYQQNVLVDPPAQQAYAIVKRIKPQITEYIIHLSEQQLRDLLNTMILHLNRSSSR